MEYNRGNIIMRDEFDDAEVPNVPDIECEEKGKALEIKIDLEVLERFFQDEMLDYVNGSLKKNLLTIVKKEIVTDRLQSYLVDECKNTVNNLVQNLLDETTEIGGMWGGPRETLTYREFIMRKIKDDLEDERKGITDRLEDIVDEMVENKISRYQRDLSNEINKKLKTMLNDVTRQTLADSVVNLLMQNDTYQRLQSSMGTLIGNTTIEEDD